MKLIRNPSRIQNGMKFTIKKIHDRKVPFMENIKDDEGEDNSLSHFIEEDRSSSSSEKELEDRGKTGI
jgi:penicillin-binding protein-related factor A (putative recombinase)